MIEKSIIKINNLSKNYKINNEILKIFSNISLNIPSKSIVSIVGPSGSGKSTLLNIIGLLDRDFQGIYSFYDDDIKNFNQKKLNFTRGSSIGFVHQFFHLIPELNVIENVMLPYLINSNNNDSYSKALQLLKLMDLDNRKNFKPIKLSGGEQQRVAIARSLINNPEIILADEMTGNLDESTAKEIFTFFLKYIKKNNKSLIFVTHNSEFANLANDIFKFENLNLKKIK